LLDTTLKQGKLTGLAPPTAAWRAHGVLLAGALPHEDYDGVAEACAKVAVLASGVDRTVSRRRNTQTVRKMLPLVWGHGRAAADVVGHVDPASAALLAGEVDIFEATLTTTPANPRHASALHKVDRSRAGRRPRAGARPDAGAAGRDRDQGGQPGPQGDGTDPGRELPMLRG